MFLHLRHVGQSKRPIVDVSPIFIIKNFAHLAVKVSTAFLLQGLFFSFIYSPTHPIFQLIKNLVKRFVHVLSKTLASCNSKCEAKVEANPNRSTKQSQQNCDDHGLVALDVGHRAGWGGCSNQSSCISCDSIHRNCHSHLWRTQGEKEDSEKLLWGAISSFF